MSNHSAGYLRALESGTLEKYHDYHDVIKRRMTRDAYEKKHGHFTGAREREKHV